MESILTSIKKMLGIYIPDQELEEDAPFDAEILAHINSVFLTLNQIGVGPSNFAIEDASTTWEDFLGEGVRPGALKTYIYLKVRLLFDPPTSSFVLDAIDRQIKEYEWRLNAKSEGGC